MSPGSADVCEMAASPEDRDRMRLPSIVALVACALAANFAVAGPAEDAALQTRLVEAAMAGDADAVGRLIAEGAVPNQPDERRYHPLLVAVECRHPDVVRALLAHGADPNVRVASRLSLVTPLLSAATF